MDAWLMPGEAERWKCGRLLPRPVAGAGDEAALRGRAWEAEAEAADVRRGDVVRQEGRVDHQPGHEVITQSDIYIFGKLNVVVYEVSLISSL